MRELEKEDKPFEKEELFLFTSVRKCILQMLGAVYIHILFFVSIVQKSYNFQTNRKTIKLCFKVNES